MLLLCLLLALAGTAAFWIDLPVSRFFRGEGESPQFRSAFTGLNRFEVFGHGIGVAVALIAVHQLDAARRWAIPRLATCVVASGLLADLFKAVIVRTRPRSFSFEGTVWNTFDGWLPWLSVGSAGESFFSGHTATAVALAGALIWLYPRGRVFFAVMAALVGCQRVVSGSHYVSDVLFGAAAGCLTLAFFFHIGRLPPWFDSLEARWKARRSAASPLGNHACRE
jgi:membrane-associated phospholipid phosphatase